MARWRSPRRASHPRPTRPAAMDAFSDRGFRGASLDKIAAAIGVTKQRCSTTSPPKRALARVLEQYERDNANGSNPSARPRRHPRADADQDRPPQPRKPRLIQLFTVLSGEASNPTTPPTATSASATPPSPAIFADESRRPAQRPHQRPTRPRTDSRPPYRACATGCTSNAMLDPRPRHRLVLATAGARRRRLRLRPALPLLAAARPPRPASIAEGSIAGPCRIRQCRPEVRQRLGHRRRRLFRPPVAHALPDAPSRRPIAVLPFRAAPASRWLARSRRRR